MSVPAPVSPQYRQFLDNLNYARTMVSAGNYMKESLTPDIYRAAWVQAVSALDHWVHQEVYERATKIVMTADGNRPKQLAAFQIPWSRVEEIKHGRRRLETVFREVLEERLSYQSYQSTRRIGEAFALVLRGGESSGDMWKAAADEIGIEVKALKSRHDDTVVKRRNQIAHESDVDPITHQRRLMTEAEASGTVDWIERLAEALTVAIRHP